MNNIRVGDLVTIERGTTYKSSLLGQPGPVLLGLGSIKRHGGFRGDSLKTYGGDSPDKLLVEPGQLYASLKDVTQSADLLGAVARLPAGHPVGRLTQDTVRLDFKCDEVGADYLFWMLQTPTYRDYCRAHATGTTTMGLSRTAFFDYQFPRPNGARLGLVELLGALDDKIAANTLILKCIAEMNMLLVAHASAAATPVNIASIASLVTRGITPRYTVDSGWTVVNQKCIRDHRVHLGPARKSEPRSPAVDRLLLTDDLLVNSTGQGTLGRTARWTASTPDVTVDSHVTIVRFDPNQVDPAFAGIAALPLEAQIELLAEGSTGQTELRRDLLGALTVQLPTLEVQKATGARIREHDDFERAVRDESARLVATRDALLPLLMSGRTTVRDAEAAM